MVEQNLVSSKYGDKNRLIWRDQTGFEVAGVVVDDVTYDTGIFIDRDYDVRSLDAVSIALENIGANSVDYTILGATKDFAAEAMDAGLADADFSEILVAEAAIVATAKDTFKLVRDSPEITAIRIRAKETVGGSSGTLRGDVRGF